MTDRLEKVAEVAPRDWVVLFSEQPYVISEIDEVHAWREWPVRAVAGDPSDDVQIMYGVAGEQRIDERELEWLPGFEQSRPVRVGNAASSQLQSA